MQIKHGGNEWARTTMDNGHFAADKSARIDWETLEAQHELSPGVTQHVLSLTQLEHNNNDDLALYVSRMYFPSVYENCSSARHRCRSDEFYSTLVTLSSAVC